MTRTKTNFYRVTPYEDVELRINGIPIPEVLVFAPDAFVALENARDLVDDPNTVFKATIVTS